MIYHIFFAFNASNSDLNYKYNKLLYKNGYKNLSYGLLLMWMPYARKIGRAICENIVLEPRKNGFFFVSENNENGK